MTQTIIIALISGLFSGGFFSFVQYLIKRSDDSKDKKDGVKASLVSIKSELEALKTYIKKEFQKSEKDALRTQIMVMIYFQPQEKESILTAGERYFKELHGDWYLTTEFNRWLTKNDIAEPEWFDSKQ